MYAVYRKVNKWHVAARADFSCQNMDGKSGMTIASDWTQFLDKFVGWAGKAAEKPVVIYGGKESRKTSRATITPWSRFHEWTSFSL